MSLRAEHKGMGFIDRCARHPRVVRGVALAAGFAVALGTTEVRAQPTPPAPPTAPAVGSARDITLSIGEQRVIPAEGIRSYSEGVPGVVDVRVPSDGSRIVLVGQRAGSTTLLLIRSNGTQETYQISVFARRPEAVQAEIENLLEGYSGVQIRRVGARLYMEGGVASEAQQRRVSQIATLYPGQVESLVSIDPTIVERRINVRIDLYFVEFRYNSTHQVGIRWPTAIGNSQNTQNFGINTAYNLFTTGTPGLITPPGFANAQAIVNLPLPELDLAQTGGWARVLRQATLITTNGTEAQYRNGGEVNVQTMTAMAASVYRIEFGTNVKVTPRYDPQSSRIDLRVEVDVSDLSDRGQVVPGRDVSHLETLVNLQLGQSIVMSGFRQRHQTYGMQGLPLISQIPILGLLFGAQSGLEEDIEGMIFVVPTVVEGISRTAQDRVAEALRQYEQFSGDVDEVRLYEPTGAQYR